MDYCYQFDGSNGLWEQKQGCKNNLEFLQIEDWKLAGKFLIQSIYEYSEINSQDQLKKIQKPNLINQVKKLEEDESDPSDSESISDQNDNDIAESNDIDNNFKEYKEKLYDETKQKLQELQSIQNVINENLNQIKNLIDEKKTNDENSKEIEQPINKIESKEIETPIKKIKSKEIENPINNVKSKEIENPINNVKSGKKQENKTVQSKNLQQQQQQLQLLKQVQQQQHNNSHSSSENNQNNNSEKSETEQNLQDDQIKSNFSADQYRRNYLQPQQYELKQKDELPQIIFNNRINLITKSYHHKKKHKPSVSEDIYRQLNPIQQNPDVQDLNKLQETQIEHFDSSVLGQGFQVYNKLQNLMIQNTSIITSYLTQQQKKNMNSILRSSQHTDKKDTSKLNQKQEKSNKEKSLAYGWKYKGKQQLLDNIQDKSIFLNYERYLQFKNAKKQLNTEVQDSEKQNMHSENFMKVINQDNNNILDLIHTEIRNSEIEQDKDTTPQNQMQKYYQMKQGHYKDMILQTNQDSNQNDKLKFKFKQFGLIKN